VPFKDAQPLPHRTYQANFCAEYVAKYATKEGADAATDDSESDDEMSSVGSFDSTDEEPAGTMEV